MKALKYVFGSLMLHSALSFACTNGHSTLIENETVKVSSSTICPNQPLPFHTHQHPRVVIPEGNGRLIARYKDRPDRIIDLKAGVPVFLDMGEGIYPHQDINDGNDVIKVTVIEMLTANK
ncbi:hypothetical protein MF265_23230 [Serratia marcescens]|uniref:hypothetical protein n=1 Tax=Serratia marcescens TaxID=615 RepID=UPI001EF0195E|nr:hypothetical protein [Serratia marcescens]ULH10791.1 hypothetical protein MF265_23230 [Serratia marcescens]